MPFSQQMEDLAGGSYGAAKPFRSQMGISQPILMLGAFRSLFEAWRPFLQWGKDFAEEGDFHGCARGGGFRSLFHSCQMGVRRCEVALVCQRVVSQLRNTLRIGGVAAK